MKAVLVTGINGFIAKNLVVNLQFKYKDQIKIHTLMRDFSASELAEKIKASDFIFHLAGENRPKNQEDFMEGNVALTKKICDTSFELKKIPILYTSSIQAEQDNVYGRSKKQAEILITEYSERAKVSSYIYRLPNVFGKWCKQNYNSFIATLCFNIQRDLQVHIHDVNANLDLVYIDDAIENFIQTFESDLAMKSVCAKYVEIAPVYRKRLGDIVDLIYKFRETSQSLLVQQTASGFERALYATYTSYISENQFSYLLKDYTDERGSFYEVVKTACNGQISISTTKPGITRGNHFHHSKNEMFLVVQGDALFMFRHLITNHIIEVKASQNVKRMIMVPTGYTHNFKNIGNVDLIVLLWANEIFDREKPDTYFLEV